MKPHRQQSDSVLDRGINAWATPDLPRHPDDDFSFGSTVTDCRDGKLSDIFVTIEDSDHPTHPTLDLIEAAIFAYTGWPADKTISFAEKLLEGRPDLNAVAPNDVKVKELPGAHAKLMVATFAIEIDPHIASGAAN